MSSRSRSRPRSRSRSRSRPRPRPRSRSRSRPRPRPRSRSRAEAEAEAGQTYRNVIETSLGSTHTDEDKAKVLSYIDSLIHVRNLNDESKTRVREFIEYLRVEAAQRP